MVAGILHHQEPEYSFPDGGYRESTALMNKEGSKSTPLQVVEHEFFQRAALFRCSWCNGEFWAGTLQEHEILRRKEAASQYSRAQVGRRLMLAAAFAALLFVVGLILGASSSYYVIIGIIGVIAFFGALLPEGTSVTQTAVVSTTTGEFSDERHFLKLIDY